MLNLTEKPKRKTRGKQPKRPEITPHQAKQEAVRLLSEHRLSTMADQVIKALATGGVLTSDQLHRIADVSLRSLQRYQRRYLLNRLPILADELTALGLADEPAALRLYTLGPVGLEIARLRHKHVPTGYIGYGTHFIIHDVLTNEVVLRLADLAAARGYELLWSSKYEATVHDERGKPVLEPDALVVFTRGEERRHFTIEFHNEDHGLRARQKVDRYERVYRDGRWRDEWETDEMPRVLVVFTHKVVGRGSSRKRGSQGGYQNAVALARSRGSRCVFLGKPWREVVAGEMDRWFNFNRGQMVDILENED